MEEGYEMNQVGKWRKVLESEEKPVEWVLLRRQGADGAKESRFLETVAGKKKRYEQEIKSGAHGFNLATATRETLMRDGEPLTSEELAYRKGWLAACREHERMWQRQKKR